MKLCRNVSSCNDLKTFLMISSTSALHRGLGDLFLLYDPMGGRGLRSHFHLNNKLLNQNIKIII